MFNLKIIFNCEFGKNFGKFVYSARHHQRLPSIGCHYFSEIVGYESDALGLESGSLIRVRETKSGSCRFDAQT